MPNYSAKLLKLHQQLEVIAKENDKTILEVKRDFEAVFTDKLALQISKEYNEVGVATQIYRKYNISEKYFRKLVTKVQKVTPKKFRPVKEFIYQTLEQYNITYDEYVKIAKYFEKHELDTEKALNKLLELRTPKKKKRKRITVRKKKTK